MNSLEALATRSFLWITPLQNGRSALSDGPALAGQFLGTLIQRLWLPCKGSLHGEFLCLSTSKAQERGFAVEIFLPSTGRPSPA